MNSRIRELLVESNNALTRNGKIYPHIGSRTIEDWEKFAELIVRECIGICDEVQTQYGQYTFTATTCKNRFKEHFGVE